MNTEEIINNFYDTDNTLSVSYNCPSSINKNLLSEDQIVNLTQFGVFRYQHLISLMHMVEMHETLAHQLALNSEEFSALLNQFGITKEQRTQKPQQQMATGLVPRGEK